ncbi:MAG: outer membrane receptor protein involved in Fe transport [Rhodothermales bacterium]|jgi:outer membrane receptor protein involved in Fe transport
MSTRLASPILVGMLFLGPVLGPAANAQNADSTAEGIRSYELDPIVITARKVASTLSSSTVGVSVLDARKLQALPFRSASSLLGYIPGMTFLDFDGLGYAPQAVTRGFYGGGEAEYVVVMLNGKPVNNLENGLVNWEQIATSPSTVIEVLRGGASSLYGDAAIGAVINVLTEPTEKMTAVLRGRTGTLGVGNLFGSIANRRYSAVAEFNTSEGFRDHSERSSRTFQGSYQLVDKDSKSLSLSTTVNLRDYETPGPLRSNDVTEDGSESLPFFQFDQATEKTFRTSLDGAWRMDAGRLSGSVTGELRDHDLTRTLPLSADFADTQERQVDALGLKATVQISDLSLPIPMDNKIVLGIDGHMGALDSRYYHIATGGIDDTYLGASGDQGDLLSDGSAMRYGIAGYAFLELNPSPRLNISAGGRLDNIQDSFDEVEGLSSKVPSTSHTAFSPKVGLNYQYTSSASQIGNVYVSASQSFKAPTLDQLYDLRAFPVPFPPYAIQISNSDLIPQEGTSIEAGFYHRMGGANGWSAMVSGSAYTIEMKNELDFSFETFSNVNIGKSRHRGVETSLNVEKNGVGSAFLNYTLQNVTFRNGDNLDNRVKAIPLHAFTAGVVADLGPLTSSLILRGTRDTYVDDANTASLPDYATLDARISYARNQYRVTLDVFNALNREYHSTAYGDPGGSDVLFIFPAALRTVSIGVEITL